MNGVISSFLGTIILFPFIVTIVILIVMRKMGKAPVKVIGLAADLTTPFLFLAIYVISYTLFDNGGGVYIAAVAITIAILLAFIERSKAKEFRILRLLRKIWRFYFLVLLAVYILLLTLGIILKIVKYVN
jgi:hypothetical protein